MGGTAKGARGARKGTKAGKAQAGKTRRGQATAANRYLRAAGLKNIRRQR